MHPIGAYDWNTIFFTGDKVNNPFNVYSCAASQNLCWPNSFDSHNLTLVEGTHKYYNYMIMQQLLHVHTSNIMSSWMGATCVILMIICSEGRVCSHCELRFKFRKLQACNLNAS